MRSYTIYHKNVATIFRHYRTVPGFFSEIGIFFTGRKKSRVGTKIVGRVGLPEPHNFFFCLNNTISICFKFYANIQK